MTTIQSYLAVAGHDTNNNDLRTALTAEGFELTDEIRNAATGVIPTLSTQLHNTYHLPAGLVARFITAADDARQQAQAQAQDTRAVYAFKKFIFAFQFLWVGYNTYYMVETGKDQTDLDKIYNILGTFGILLTSDLILIVMGAISIAQCIIWCFKQLFRAIGVAICENRDVLAYILALIFCFVVITVVFVYV